MPLFGRFCDPYVKISIKPDGGPEIVNTTNIRDDTPLIDDMGFTMTSVLIHKHSTSIKIQILDSDSKEPDSKDELILEKTGTVDDFMKKPETCNDVPNCVEVDIIWLDKNE